MPDATTSSTMLSLIKDIVSIVAVIISAIALFVYTQRDKQSFLTININSNKYMFSVDLVNVGPSLARIKKIKLEKISGGKLNPLNVAPLIELFGAKGYAPVVGNIDSAELTIQGKSLSYGQMFSNLTGDVIEGGGTKHHLFRCLAKDMDSLKTYWDILKDYKMTITYTDVYGFMFWRRRKCVSHFAQDYESFKAALGNRTEFSDKVDMK